MKTLTIKIDEELRKKFKIYSIKMNKDMQEIIVEYIEKLLKEGQQPSTKVSGLLS
jgi:predicted transcriptional regulator